VSDVEVAHAAEAPPEEAVPGTRPEDPETRRGAMARDADEIRAAVRERYARAATTSARCGPVDDSSGLFGRELYRAEDAEVLPDAALAASL
jgi:hypothetical protein